MALEQIFPSLYRVPLKAVNAFVIDLGDDGLVLIDAGTPDDTKAILEVVGELGRRSADVRHILVTHCHADHAGGLAELKKATGAPAYMHPADAEMVRVGRALRPLTPTPGPLNRAVFWLFLRNGPKTLPATGVEHEVSDGEVLPFAGGIRAVHAPGHCAGQLAFFWPRHGGVLLRGRRRGQRGGPPGPLPRPQGPGRGEAQREEARRIGLRNGLLRPRPGDPARGVSALQKGFRVGQKATAE
ncbi:MAG: MBL fold metallo-hydrolase [Actinomycetota bacterium]|nr:MBL fold metallo-hydrolase [Actinomycetota bacterium]